MMAQAATAFYNTKLWSPECYPPSEPYDQNQKSGEASKPRNQIFQKAKNNPPNLPKVVDYGNLFWIRFISL